MLETFCLLCLPIMLKIIRHNRRKPKDDHTYSARALTEAPYHVRFVIQHESSGVCHF